MLRPLLIPALLLAAGPGALRAQTDYYARLGVVGASTLVRDVLGTEITVRQSLAPMVTAGAAMPISPGYRAGVEADQHRGGPVRFLAGAGADWRHPVLPSWDLMVSARYDFHRFTTDELERRGFSQAQGVSRVSLSVGIARGIR